MSLNCRARREIAGAHQPCERGLNRWTCAPETDGKLALSLRAIHEPVVRRVGNHVRVERHWHMEGDDCACHQSRHSIGNAHDWRTSADELKHELGELPDTEIVA